jgi:hypothetical protein
VTPEVQRLRTSKLLAKAVWLANRRRRARQAKAASPSPAAPVSERGVKLLAVSNALRCCARHHPLKILKG